MAVHPTYEQEQALVREFFGGETSGYFVEVGANHPTQGSQTWHLEQAGWTGVLVEPQPDLAAFLVTSRKARVFAVACSSPDNAGQTLPLHIDGPRSALDRDRMAPGSQAAYVIVVPTRTLDSILDEAAAPVPIELLSIDVEGHEVEVLQGFDFGRWQPALILIEDHVNSLDDPPLSEAERLSPDPASRLQRLVRSRRRGCDRRRGAIAGRSCASIIWRCRSGCCATSRAGSGGSMRTGGPGASMRPSPEA